MADVLYMEDKPNWHWCFMQLCVFLV